MKLKPIFTIDWREKKVRLLRVIWERGTVGDGKGYSAFLSLNLMPKILGFSRDRFQWRLTLLGISLHRKISFGGKFC